MALFYGPDFDYDPQSEEALAAAQQAPLPAPPAAYGPAVDDLSTQPTEEDYAQAAIDQANRTAGDAGVVAAEGSVIQDEIDDAVALQEAAIAARRAAGLPTVEASAEERAAARAQLGMGMVADARQRAGRESYVKVTKENKAYAPTKKATDILLGTDGRPGLFTQQENAALATKSAELVQARAATDLLQQEADMQRDLDSQLWQREQLRQQRMEEQRAAVTRAHQAVQKADRDFQNSEEIDPDKGWGDKGVFAQILAVISAGLLGFAGMDPFAHIDAVTDRSLAAQRANLDRKRARVDSAQGVQAAQENLLGWLRTQTGDERVADEAFRVWSLQQIQKQAMAKLADAGVDVQAAQSHEFILGLKQKIVDATRQMEIVAATTVPFFTSYVDPRTPDQKRIDMKLAESGIRTAEKAGDQAIDIAAKRQEGVQTRESAERIAETGVRAKEVEARSKAIEKTIEERAKADAEILKNTREWGAVEQMVDDFLGANPEEIHGSGIPLTGTRGERISTDSFNQLLPQMLIKAITGANFSEEQGEAAKRLAEGSWDEFSDADKRARLRAIKNLASSQRRYLQKQLAPDQTPDYLQADPIEESSTGFSTYMPEP